MPGAIDDHLAEGIGAHDYARAEDGLVWETYLGEEVVVQCPAPGDEYLVSLMTVVHDRLREHGARVPAVVDSRDTPPAYLAVERVGERGLPAVREDGDGWLEAVESAGEVLGQMHSVEGDGYGDIDPGDHGGSHETWRSFCEDLVDRVVERIDGGRFERVATSAAERFVPERIPERPTASILHNDFHDGNVLVDSDGRAWVIDFDHVVYGDDRYGYVRSERLIAGGDEAARAAFREGYEAAHGPAPDEDGALRDQYVLLSIVKSAEGGDWVRRNRTGQVDLDDWATDLEEWYRERFG